MTGYLFYMGCAAGVRLSATEPNRGRRERVRQAPSCPRGTPGPKALSLSESHEAGVREERLSVMASSAPPPHSFQASLDPAAPSPRDFPDLFPLLIIPIWSQSCLLSWVDDVLVKEQRWRRKEALPFVPLPFYPPLLCRAMSPQEELSILGISPE